MRSPRLSLAVTALFLLTAVSACSSSDDSDEPKADQTPSAASESSTVYPVGGCQAKVAVTGALKASWKGDGMATEAGDAMLYQSSNNKSSWIAVTTATKETPAQVVVTVKGTTYTVQDKSVKVAESEGALTANAAASVAKGKKAQVKARFSCEEKAG